MTVWQGGQDRVGLRAGRRCWRRAGACRRAWCTAVNTRCGRAPRPCWQDGGWGWFRRTLASTCWRSCSLILGVPPGVATRVRRSHAQITAWSDLARAGQLTVLTFRSWSIPVDGSLSRESAPRLEVIDSRMRGGCCVRLGKSYKCPGKPSGVAGAV
jgi:hypothetical protein